jgi:hypothetical protein
VEDRLAFVSWEFVALLDEVAAAARTFLAGLDEEQTEAAVLPFDDEERRTWAYWPTERRGTPLWSLDRRQTKAAHRLVATLLEVPAYARAVTIMGLDEILDRLEGYGSDRRHREDYWVSIFGSPGDERWGVRFEGHHISVHATFSEGEARLTPLFLGANPATVPDGGRPAVAPLAPEEELGFELLHSLSTEQRAAAVISDEAPDDILTRNRPRLDQPVPRGGVLLSALRSGAAACAQALLDVYLGRFPAGAVRPDPRDATFSWAGADRRGAGHYYRIAGPRLLIEFDNTQNGANHIHTVVRDPLADFGDDLLAAHLRGAHTSRPE